MKAEIINAKAVRLTDIDNDEYTVLVEDVEECLIERDSKKLEYFVNLANLPDVIVVDHDTYNFLLAIIKESVEVCSKNAVAVMEAGKVSSKEITFFDTDGVEHTVFAKDVQGLSLGKCGRHLEYYVKLFSEGYYSMEVNFKTYYMLLAALKAVAHAKEQDNGQSKKQN